MFVITLPRYFYEICETMFHLTFLLCYTFIGIVLSFDYILLGSTLLSGQYYQYTLATIFCVSVFISALIAITVKYNVRWHEDILKYLDEHDQP